MFDYHLLYYYLFNESKEYKMQKKNETRKMNKEIEEMANGYYIENNKIVYFSNMLDGYKDENHYKKNDCLSFQEMKAYLGNKNGYDWHISNLKIYDKPKELSEFINPCSRVKCISGCKDMKIEHAECLNKNKRPITRPPQSYMFVEEL